MAPRSTQENQRLREEQRDRILAAALPVFVQKGFTATKMADIAAACEMGYGSVYHYFPDKMAIFKALIEQAMQNRARFTQIAQEMPGTPWERLHWWLSQTIGWMRKSSEIILFITQALTDETPHQELKTLIHELRQAYQHEIKQLIIEGQAARQIVAGDPEQLTIAVWSYLQGFAIEAAFDPDHLREHTPGTAILLRLLKP